MDANKTKKKKRRNGRKKKATAEQTLYAKSVREWVSLDSSSSSSSSDSTPPSLDHDFGLRSCVGDDKLVFDLHSHSIFSDGFLSPTALVERAHRNGRERERQWAWRHKAQQVNVTFGGPVSDIQSAQDCKADMKTPSVNPAEHLVFTTMLIVFTTYTMEKAIEYVIFDPTIVLPHHLHPITTSFFMTTLLWSTSGGVFHVAFNVFEEMSTNLSSAISHSMKSFPLIFPITSAGDLHQHGSYFVRADLWIPL
ncbi:hypothetical protein Syun_003718 [Stephania yunnanensis]|uniref:Uncharacterized protein n=1 Tax=Stephania yunnanensis TaxID=152371 RepID=A0AAP0L1T0_9MAGN